MSAQLRPQRTAEISDLRRSIEFVAPNRAPNADCLSAVANMSVTAVKEKQELSERVLPAVRRPARPKVMPRSSAPIFLGLPPYRRAFRILALEPVTRRA